jgi:hypothetical protein
MRTETPDSLLRRPGCGVYLYAVLGLIALVIGVLS